MKTCPYCAESIDDAATTCPYCRSDLTAPMAAPPPASAPPPSRGSNVGCIVAVIVAVAVFGLMLIGVLIALLLPAVQQAREAARRTACKNNLKQIGLALHNYHDVYNSFPPAYVTDEDGTPLYSWRVLILPYLEQGALYESFDHTQAWDSPANQFVLQSMPSVFRCPSDSDVMSNNTAYAGVFGPDCAFQPDGTVSFRDILDGTSTTVMVGEVAEAEIPWTKPEDIAIADIPDINVPAGFSSDHVGGVHFLFCDGAVQFISEEIGPDVLESMYLIDDAAGVAR